MNELIGEYEVVEPLKIKNGGMSRWGIVKKNNQEYFIKEWLNPVYPTKDSGLSESTIERKKKICKDFEENKKKKLAILNEASDGNLMRIENFFRYKSKYFLIAEKYENVGIEEVIKLSKEDKYTIIKVLVHSLMNMHKKGLIHGDIKLDNIMFVRTKSGKITAKIIDDNDCFFSEEISGNIESLCCDFVYLSPEVYRVLSGDNIEINEYIDVFSMGIVFHQILTGKMPQYNKEKYAYFFQSVLDGNQPVISSEIENKYADIIKNMLLANNNQRWSMATIFSYIIGDVVIYDNDNKELLEELLECEEKNKENIENKNAKDDKKFGFVAADEL